MHNHLREIFKAGMLGCFFSSIACLIAFMMGRYIAVGFMAGVGYGLFAIGLYAYFLKHKEGFYDGS